MIHPIVTFLARIGVVFAVVGCGSPPEQMPPGGPSQLALHLDLPDKITADSKRSLKITITNIGDSKVRLVLPGDGSQSHWRTPIVSWSILPSDSDLLHPQSIPRPISLPRCGNINSLNRDQIFTLEPGENRQFRQWVSFPSDVSSGSYRVVFYYSNLPHIKWSGDPLGNHDATAMAEVRTSTRVALMSNEVEVVVVK